MKQFPAARAVARTCFPPAALLLMVLAALPRPLAAQDLPSAATPRGLVFAFLTETASHLDSVNRTAFRNRLVGEMAHTDPKSFKGLVPAGTRLRIDSIPNLRPLPDGTRRALAYVTVDISGERENWSVFCRGDSIWRIEALRRFPNPMQRAQIKQSLRTLDTTTYAYRTLRSELAHSLCSDDSLRSLFRRGRTDASRLVDLLRRGNHWSSIALNEVDFGKLEEYRELDDDIEPSQLIFYTLDRKLLQGLEQQLGPVSIERDSRNPDLVYLVMGTLEKQTFGFLNAPDPTKLPELSPDGFIVLKPVDKGWWLYKRMR
ncbi:MAG TPA: hypothetical protein VHI13_08465 [Candidatus Kapabacteria bacterium]|nr:hypothetical protein [Candidatus Kapabacteria bacterium]